MKHKKNYSCHLRSSPKMEMYLIKLYRFQQYIPRNRINWCRCGVYTNSIYYFLKKKKSSSPCTTCSNNLKVKMNKFFFDRNKMCSAFCIVDMTFSLWVLTPMTTATIATKIDETEGLPHFLITALNVLQLIILLFVASFFIHIFSQFERNFFCLCFSFLYICLFIFFALLKTLFASTSKKNWSEKDLK